MFRKNYFTFLLAAALFLVGGIPVFAQYAQISGRVQLTKADGSKVPVADALVEIFRLDQKVKLSTNKTDKKGNFAFAGIQLGGKYVLAVSGAGIAPAILPNISPGMDSIVVPVSVGDGKRWTEEEVKQSLTTRTNTTATTNTTQNTVSEDDKKREEEIRKKNEQILADNERIKKSNETINTSQKDGFKAFQEKNFDLAITIFEQGYNAAPTFPASAPVFLNNLAASYIERIRANYKNIKPETKASIMESIKSDSQKAVESSEKSLAVLKTATPKDEKQRLEFESRKFDALRNRKEAYYLMVRTGADRTKGKEAVVAFQEYLAVETDAAEKMKAQFVLAEILLDIQEADQAFAEYEKILAVDSSNVDALAGAGFSLVSVAYNNNEDKAKFQMAANYLQKFFDLAPATHPRKADAKLALDTIKKDYKISPQKMSK